MVLWMKDSHSSVRNDVWIPRTRVTLLRSQHSKVEAGFLAQAYLARLSGSVSSSFSREISVSEVERDQGSHCTARLGASTWIVTHAPAHTAHTTQTPELPTHLQAHHTMKHWYLQKMVIHVFSPVVTSAERCKCHAEIRPRYELLALCKLELTIQDEHLTNGRAGEAPKKWPK